MRISCFLLCILCCIGPENRVDAQAFRRRQALPEEQPPKAILLQLNTGYSRLKRGGRQEFLRELVKDMKIANERMILDFEDNFSFCPVYYFYDSNLHYITNGEFFGYLMDAKGQLLDTRVIPEGDTSFFIVHFGYMMSEGSQDLDLPLTQKMLIASNHKGQMLPSPLPNTSLPVDTRKYKTKKFKSEYRYNSKVTDIYYRPRALHYSILLKQFYGRPVPNVKPE